MYQGSILGKSKKLFLSTGLLQVQSATYKMQKGGRFSRFV